jgi:hypothetical protein
MSLSQNIVNEFDLLAIDLASFSSKNIETLQD